MYRDPRVEGQYSGPNGFNLRYAYTHVCTRACGSLCLLFFLCFWYVEWPVLQVAEFGARKLKHMQEATVFWAFEVLPVADSSAHTQKLAHGQKRNSRRQLSQIPKCSKWNLGVWKAWAQISFRHGDARDMKAKGRQLVLKLPAYTVCFGRLLPSIRVEGAFQTSHSLDSFFADTFLRTRDWNDPRGEGIESESRKYRGPFFLLHSSCERPNLKFPINCQGAHSFCPYQNPHGTLYEEP